MKIGIIREGKVPVDKRVPFNPEHCSIIEDKYPQVELLVQKSEHRAFSNEEYAIEGLTLVNELSSADIIFGVKEVRIEDLLPNKTYFFFSHTIKKQEYNRGLLRAVLERNIQLVDYECLTDKNGMRLLGFGRYAGIVGTYNAFLTYGKRSGRFTLKPAHLCSNREEMELELQKVSLPKGFKILITGLGRVAGGAREILDLLPIEEVSAQEILNSDPKGAQFAQLTVEDYFRKADGSDFSREEVYNHPERFESDFFKYSKSIHLFIPCHYWDDRGPGLISSDELAHPDFKIEVIADISCDIAGPIASTIRPSTIADPIYEVDKSSGEEVGESSDETVSVMAVDNLPCELPREASTDFGQALIEKILPCLLEEDPDRVIERASIAKDGKLMPDYAYLQDYVDGKE